MKPSEDCANIEDVRRYRCSGSRDRRPHRQPRPLRRSRGALQDERVECSRPRTPYRPCSTHAANGRQRKAWTPTLSRTSTYPRRLLHPTRDAQLAKVGLNFSLLLSGIVLDSGVFGGLVCVTSGVFGAVLTMGLRKSFTGVIRVTKFFCKAGFGGFQEKLLVVIPLRCEGVGAVI